MGVGLVGRFLLGYGSDAFWFQYPILIVLFICNRTGLEPAQHVHTYDETYTPK